MKRRLGFRILAPLPGASKLLAALVLLAAGGAAPAAAQVKLDAQWIWHPGGDQAREAPPGTVWFRRVVYMSGPCTGEAFVACDDEFILWVNGRRVGQGGGRRGYHFNLNGIVRRGRNVIAVQARNQGGPAGLFVDGAIRHQGGQVVPFDTGPQWRCTRNEPPPGWLTAEFDDSAWQKAQALGRHEQTPWREIRFPTDYLARFQLPPGFRVTQAAGHELTGSLVCMTWGTGGHLLVSVERGPVLSLADTDGDGRFDRKVVFTDQVKNCQGLCQVGQVVYAVGQGPQGTGIYRLPDRDGDQRADQVQLVLKHRGGMGEHGPHNVVLGPDGWLYHNLGNHAWVPHEPEPTSAVRHTYEGDLLRPRFEDARGHARGIKVPGGTIWRFTPEGKKWFQEVVGFRNHYDIGFNQWGHLFTFDSDMEWDVGLPWYRPVRVCHCVPGAEFGWRSGAAKWPPYYFDSLPAAVDIGRGSPTGVVFYEHTLFPEKYRGAFLICDWSMGRIIAVFLKPQGATFTGSWETLVAGNPLNVSDIEVDRDGTVLFCTGGRGTRGGIYRLHYGSEPARPTPQPQSVEQLLASPQPQAAWNRQMAARLKEKLGPQWAKQLEHFARSGTARQRVRALAYLAQLGPKPSVELLAQVAAAGPVESRQFALWLLGDHPTPETARVLQRLLQDDNPALVRRALEAYLRSGLEPPLESVFELLGHRDRFVRFAASRLMSHVPVEQIQQRVLRTSKASNRLNYGALALFRQGKLPVKLTLDRAMHLPRRSDPQLVIDTVRLLQLCVLAGIDGPDVQKRLAQGAAKGFSMTQQPKLLVQLGFTPAQQVAVQREFARLVAALDAPDAAKTLLDALEKTPDRQQQIHYALCLAYVKSSWNTKRFSRLLDWFERTQAWEGGHSMQPYLANLVARALENATPQQRKELLASWQQRPWATGLVLRRSRPEQIADLDQVLDQMIATVEQKQLGAGAREVLEAAIGALGRSGSPAAKAVLRKLIPLHADYRDQLIRALAQHPREEDFPLLVQALGTDNRATLQLVLQALLKLKTRPQKADAFRAVIVAGLRLGEAGGKAATALLARWTGSPHPGGVPVAQALKHYQQWYAKRFPNAPAAELPKVDPSRSKYTLEQLVRLLERTPGDAQRGRQVFEKATCLKCHRFGDQGAAVGPDLSTVRRRFTRKEILESVLFPSAVISDQYRSVTVVTDAGQVFTGLRLPEAPPGKVVLLLPDATKLELERDSIEQMAPAKVSVMPEGLLNPLSPQEIADLFAFLETSRFAPVEPSSKQAAGGGK